MANQEMLATRGGPNLFADVDALIANGRPTEEKSFDNTRAFLSELTFHISQGRARKKNGQTESLDLKGYVPPIGLLDTVEKQTRRLEITARYISEYSESATEVAERFNLKSRERIRQVVTDTLTSLWNNAPYYLRQKYPIKTLDTDKRNSLHYGLTGKIASALVSGENTESLNERFGVNSVRNIRKKLVRFNVEVPYVQRPLRKRFAGLRNPDATREQIQELLDEIGPGGRYRTLLRSGFVINLSRVAKQAGLFTDTSDILPIWRRLRAQGLPAGKCALKIKRGSREQVLYYYFIAATNLDEATDILRSSTEFTHLKQNPVEQVAGTKNEPPNTTKLECTDDYGFVGSLIREITGKRFGGNGYIKMANMIIDSPVPVYKTRRGHNFYYPTAQKEKMKKFLIVRLKELQVD